MPHSISTVTCTGEVVERDGDSGSIVALFHTELDFKRYIMSVSIIISFGRKGQSPACA